MGAYDEGRVAYSTGDINPYIFGIEHYKEWERGFAAAEGQAALDKAESERKRRQ